MKKTLIACAAALLVVGCIVKESHHTLYLDPDGSLTWTVLEEQVRSDARTVAERDKEEANYLASIAGDYPVAVALSNLGGFDVRTNLLRQHRPYLVITQAEFDSVADLAWEILARFGVPGEVSLSENGEEHVLEITAWTGEVYDTDSDDDEAFLELLSADGPFRIVLTEGRFVRASGFTLDDEGRVAVLLEVSEEELEETQGLLHFSLVWTER